MATTTVADSFIDSTPPIPPPQLAEDGHGAEEEEDDGDTCRICRNPGSSDDPLRYPCACRGSIRFVHEQCLLLWLNRRNSKSCEICKHTFSFNPVYAESTPPTLSFRELFLLASSKAKHSLLFLLRFSFVVFAWIFMLPCITFRIWQFTLARSLSDATKLFSDKLFIPEKILIDSLLGILLILGIVVVTLVGTCLLKYLIRLLRGPDSHEIGGQNGRQRMNGPVGVRGPDPGARDIGNENGEQQVNGNDAAALVAPVQVEAVGVAAENQSFEEFAGMKGPIQNLLMNWIEVLVMIAVLLCILSFLPFSLGRMVLYYRPFFLSCCSQYKQSAAEIMDDDANTTFVETPNLSDLSAIAVGYTSTLGPVIIYISFKYAKASHGGIRRLLLSFQVLLLEGLRHLMVSLKAPLIIFVEISVFPLIFGWWIDVCSLALVGCTIDLRLHSFLVDPVRSTYVHLILGFTYVFLLNSFIEDVQEVLHKRVRGFLFMFLSQDPEPIDTILAEPASYHAYRLLLIFCTFGSSIVMVIYMPARLIMQLDLVSSIFPLNLDIPAIHAHILLYLVFFPIIIMHFKYPRSTIRAFLRQWFTIVGRAVNLTDTLLPTDLANNLHENWHGEVGRQGSEPDLHGSSNTVEVHELDDQAGHKYFLFRVMLLLVLALISILLLSTAMIVLPAFIGRVVFEAVPHPAILDAIWKCDLFAFTLGLYILVHCLVMARSFISIIRNRDVLSLVSKSLKWCSTDLKNMLLYSIWISSVPLLIGLLLHALLLPLAVTMNESLVFQELHLHWVFGAILLRFISLIIAVARFNINDDSFSGKVVRIELYGLGHFRGFSALTEVILPMFSHLLTALCFPYVLAQVILPLVGLPHLHYYAWIVFLALRVVCIFARKIPFWVKRFHDYLKDDRYLIERKLCNYGEEKLHVM
ncbi:RING/FYVE/PHD zinc finger superfamily protein [Rhynchospora pubera]|uniref:RING/FYVE/PHD zinc finger superfamily protein n=1 Tax=Rhynchospora pubera TaxID=906938 RepID=A0AAV8FM61_9POAL|nr:RING/FYVE/PHD zinc finger superfamily protein [Rhynchospora pubera]